ncbi:hypothetical protein L596_021727 [Steinernema carpocapsae]|uniref:Cilia- and flagella-associated protein 36 n=1 Tax=Steinernema carpocapsae TaxID=34508 RepID=A0A4U5MJN3_STECR|nr:hypothetical protein L596_021727 [Steinernema carpocapsae]
MVSMATSVGGLSPAAAAEGCHYPIRVLQLNRLTHRAAWSLFRLVILVAKRRKTKMLRRRSSTPGKQMPLKTVFAKFMEFLGSSMWTLSIATFIEQKSIVFDREQGNPEAYAEIHKEFSSFVDTLIECFCEDLKITPRSLVDSLKSNDDKKLTTKEKQLLEPVVAAQDYDVFVPMMMRKNVELQLQALHMIEVMCGLLPTVLTVEEDEETQRVLADADETERYILIQVLQQSKAEWERDQANRALLQKQFEDAVRESLLDRARLMAMKESEEKAMSDAMSCNIKSFADLKIGAEERAKSAAINGERSVEKEKERQKEAEKLKAAKALEAEAEKAKEAEKAGKAVEVGKPKDSSPKNEKPEKSEKTEKPQKAEKSSEKPVRAKTPATPNRIERPRSRSNSKSPNPVDKTTVSKAASVDAEVTKRRPSTSKKPPKQLGDVKPPKGPMTPKQLEPEEDKTAFDYKALLRDSEGGINPDAIKARAMYLQEQRNKLLALKQQEREKQFHEEEAKTALERPKTAKFARGALRGAAKAKAVNDDVMETRKAVASKLKSEVIHQ